MKKFFLIVLLIVAVVILYGLSLTRDGRLVTPQGSGTVTLDSGTYEAFPLPNYTSKFLSEGYKSYLVEVEPGIKIHVLEKGSGYPVYMQHGNPTSGMLYRKVAEALSAENVRVIMPTMPGLGFSSKIPASKHQLGNHVRWMNRLLSELQLAELIYVGQDWGGPVGMGALAMSPNLLKGAVVMNTGFNAPTEKRDLSKAHALAKTPIAGELMLEGFFSLFDRLPAVQGDPDSMLPEVVDLYKRPVVESGNSKAGLALMRMVTDGPDHASAEEMRKIESYVKSLNIPAELVWGMKDPILAKGLPTMMENFPNAGVTKTEAGHFLQEEVPNEIAAAVIRVLGKLDSE